MEVKRECRFRSGWRIVRSVSILVLMEVKRENALNAEQIETILFQSLF